MDANRKTRAVIARWEREQGAIRTAAGAPPFPPSAPPLHKGDGVDVKRDIPKNHEFDPKALKPMAKMLWAMSVSLGHALAAYKQFNKVKSVTVSPDGMVGGRGFVMSVKDVRLKLYEACEALSAVSDTVHDEINGPHWKPKLADLSPHDAEDVTRFMEEAEENLEDPEAAADEDMEEIEDEEAPSKGTTWAHPAKRNEEKDEPGSELPDAGDKETLPSQGKHPAGQDHPTNRQMKQASGIPNYSRVANSTVPVETMPGGPRVEHLDRADDDQTGPLGAIRDTSTPASGLPGSDDWAAGGDRLEDYPSDWSADMSSRGAASSVPDSATDPTPTQGFDFGVGRGNGDDAHGQGAGGYGNGSGEDGGRGVWGPSSGLPNDPGGEVHDHEEGDPMAGVELEVGGGRHRFSYDWSAPSMATAELPNDGELPVARSDYYTGDKGNLVNGESGLPGTQMPAKPTPLTPRPKTNEGFMFGESGLPGDGGPSGLVDSDKDGGPGTTERAEPVSQPYVLWDDSTHEMRPDYNYQRGPQTAPYTKDGL